MPIVMLVLPFIAFVFFFACALAQFVLGRNFRRKLVERHPDVWAEISRKSWLMDGAVLGFANSRRCRDLADPELSQAANWIKLTQVLAISSWLVIAFSIFFAVSKSG